MDRYLYFVYQQDYAKTMVLKGIFKLITHARICEKELKQQYQGNTYIVSIYTDLTEGVNK